MSKRLERDMRRADRTAQKRGYLVTHPIARFNLSLEGQNSDWIPQESAGEGNFFARTQIQELSRKIPVETGQYINTLLLNGDRLQADERKRGLVYVTEFNTSITDGPCAYRLRALAKQLGCPVLGLDNPSVGGSSGYTKEQLEALRDRGDFGPAAEALVDAIVASGMQEISLVGVSLGGWIVPFVAQRAKEMGLTVHDMVVAAAPGAQELTTKELRKGEFEGGKYLDLYQGTPYDPEMREVTGQNSLGGIKAKLGGARWLATAALRWRSSMALTEAMARGELEGRIRVAFGEKDKNLKLTVMYSSLDAVSLKGANDTLVNNLQADFPGQVYRMIIPGESHLFYENGNRFASLVRHTLLDSPLLQRD